jgi:hypothetical protein
MASLTSAKLAIPAAAWASNFSHIIYADSARNDKAGNARDHAPIGYCAFHQTVGCHNNLITDINIAQHPRSAADEDIITDAGSFPTCPVGADTDTLINCEAATNRFSIDRYVGEVVDHKAWPDFGARIDIYP